MFWTIIPLCQFYKLYVQHFYVPQSFTIRKTLSTRYNLLGEDYNQQYQASDPCINLGTKTYNYSGKDAGWVFESTKVKIPIEEELINSQQYQDKVGINMCISSNDKNKKDVNNSSNNNKVLELKNNN